MTKLCETCKWFVAEVSVCTNADSRHCADFVGKYCGSENAVEYRDLKARQAKAYRKEYYKALTREEPQIGDRIKFKDMTESHIRNTINLIKRGGGGELFYRRRWIEALEGELERRATPKEKNCKECHKDKRTLKFCEATGFCRYDEEMWELLKEI